MEIDIRMEEVNQHYLDKVMDLAEELEVEASEDIYDARGIKLIAKGARISRSQQEKLILHKLRKPLEACIIVHGGINANMIHIEAERLADTCEPVRCLLNVLPQSGPSPVDAMRDIELGNAMNMMLTIVDKGGQAAFAHSVMVGLLGICFARRLALSEEQQQVAGLAGLLHDIGELYIAPEFLHSSRRLLPHEWRHVVVHPRVGQMLVDQLEKCSRAVGVAIAEHHERCDGGGYPRQVDGCLISPAGHAVSAADLVSAIYAGGDRPLERSDLALKIVPGEHDRQLVDAICSALRQPHDIHPALPQADAIARMQALHHRIDAVTHLYERLERDPALGGSAARKLLARTRERVAAIARAYSSTGLDTCVPADAPLFAGEEPRLAFEASVALQEIEWRLRDVARDIALSTREPGTAETAALQPLIALLDQDRPPA